MASKLWCGICLAGRTARRLSQRRLQKSYANKTFQRRNTTPFENLKTKTSLHNVHGDKPKILPPQVYFTLPREKGSESVSHSQKRTEFLNYFALKYL